MKRIDIIDVLNKKNISKHVSVYGWIKSIRNYKNVCFIELNDGTSINNLQVVIDPTKSNSLKDCTIGSIIRCRGILSKSSFGKNKFELDQCNLSIISKCPVEFPLQKNKQTIESLRNIPHLRSRANTFNAIFKVRSTLSLLIHEYFQENNYCYVNTPIISPSNFEGAGNLFRVTTLDIDKISREKYNSNLDKNDFFGKKVSLTLSGQLEAEALSWGLGKVYTFAPTFRAENSNTKKHAAEFWMVETEASFTNLNEMINEVINLIGYVTQRLLKKCANEIEFFNKYYDNNLITRLNNLKKSNFSIIDYTEAINILKDSNIKFRFPVSWGCDLMNEHIKYLTENKFNGPVFIKNFPKELKPFYVKENSDSKTVASADLFFPNIGDIIGVTEKESDYYKLEKKIDNLQMNKEEYLWYLDLRKYGSIPHSGFGLGVERMMMLVTGIENIQDLIPFPRMNKKIKI